MDSLLWVLLQVFNMDYPVIIGLTLRHNHSNHFFSFEALFTDYDARFRVSHQPLSRNWCWGVVLFIIAWSYSSTFFQNIKSQQSKRQ